MLFGPSCSQSQCLWVQLLFMLYILQVSNRSSTLLLEDINRFKLTGTVPRLNIRVNRMLPNITVLTRIRQRLFGGSRQRKGCHQKIFTERISRYAKITNCYLFLDFGLYVPKKRPKFYTSK